jgi:hypothetical protein
MGAPHVIRLGREFERLAPGIVALATSVVVGVLIVAVSHGVDRPPIIGAIDVKPPQVPRNKTADVTVTASDPDGTPLKYDYSAESGTLKRDAGRAEHAVYAPAAVGSIADRVTVRVTDAGGLQTTRSIIVTVEGAVVAPEPPPAAVGDPAVTEESEPPPPPPPSGPNNAPVLNGGGTQYKVGDDPRILEATGMDPDGHQISFQWEFGTCLISATAEVAKAEVKLRPGCASGTATLTWTDEIGATAAAEWTLHR